MARGLTIAAFAALLVVAFSGPVMGQAIPGRYIVVFHDDVVSPETAATEIASRHGVIVDLVYSVALRGFAGHMTSRQLAEVAGDPRVAYVEQDQLVHAVSHRPGHNPGGGGSPPPPTAPPQTLPTGVNRIDAELSLTARIDGVDDRVNVDIAIIDTGIDTSHPDLYVFKHARCTGTGSNTDQNGHGTHVAGTAAAKDNGYGVVGVAPGARLWGVKVLDATGSGSVSCVAAGVDYVTSNASRIEVANMSLGFEGTSQALNTAIARSVAAGVTYAVAAGNSSRDAATFSPANHPDVITVSAITDTDGQGGRLGPLSSWGGFDRNGDGLDDGLDDTFAFFSNFGSLVEIAAPGVDINSTWMAGGYNSISGTSMASPHVAGAAALYKAGNPAASPAAVRAALIAAGTPQAAANGYVGDPDNSAEPLLNAAGF